VDVISNKLRDMGLTDYFDTIIYATAKVKKACLITEDQELQGISEIKPITNEVIDWKTFIQVYL
jgi:predicted nuclease of predicted toxin-antitoxin system